MTEKALLLCAGYGTRLKPITNFLPKCLVPIRGRPLLDYWIADLLEAGFTDIFLNTHYLPELVFDYVEACAYQKNIKILHEPQLLGTAGTLKSFLQNTVLKKGGEDIFVAHADNWLTCPIGQFIDFHRQISTATCMSMMTFLSNTPESCGVVSLKDQFIVSNFIEKPTDYPDELVLANGAVYMLASNCLGEIIDLCPNIGGISDQLLPSLIGKIAAWRNCFVHRDIGTFDELRLAQQDQKPVTKCLVNSEWLTIYQRTLLDNNLSAFAG